MAVDKADTDVERVAERCGREKEIAAGYLTGGKTESCPIEMGVIV